MVPTLFPNLFSYRYKKLKIQMLAAAKYIGAGLAAIG